MNYIIIISPIVTILSLLLTILWNWKKTKKQERADLISKTKEDSKVEARLNALEKNHESNEKRIEGVELSINNILMKWFTEGFKKH